ncbi:MAG: hypothetical protein JWQ43_3128 [Glaciihabitans sp.]|nr:hypothetical protein [Glaciihabitans sp.]
MTNYWLGVVQRSHVDSGVRQGIVQTNHGSKAGLLRMQPGDGLVYYSPRTDHPEGAPLREFTAIGRITDAEPWEATEGDRHPWRRSADYDDTATATSITPLLPLLDFTRDTPNWGYQLRRGQLPVSQHDFEMIADAMGAAKVLR